MNYLIALLLFLGTFSAYAGPNTDDKTVVGESAAGVFFAIKGQESLWLCTHNEARTEVSCDTQGKRYYCDFEEVPVFFSNCDEGKDEVPAGITLGISI